MELVFATNETGSTIPPAITAATLFNAIPHAGWWFDFLTTEPLTFSSFDRWDGTVAELMDTMFDPTVSFDDLAWIVEHWPNKVVVKGIQTLQDAKKVASMGVDGVLLSNHGGRQLDRAPIPFHLLPEVVREIGTDVEVHVDTGIMSGADVVACVALGARMTLVGRAYLYGLMAGGRAGVDRTIEILADQIERTMRLLGVACLEELDPGHVTQLRRLEPFSAVTRPIGICVKQRMLGKTGIASRASSPSAGCTHRRSAPVSKRAAVSCVAPWSSASTTSTPLRVMPTARKCSAPSWPTSMLRS